jgi:YD repeat-containing protein
MTLTAAKPVGAPAAHGANQALRASTAQGAASQCYRARAVGTCGRASSSVRCNATPGKWRIFGYNAVGNLTSESRHDGSRSYSYDVFGRLNGASINGALVGDYRNKQRCH